MGLGLSTVPEIAAKILKVFREKAKGKESAEIAAVNLYEAFRHEYSHDTIQSAIRFLVDRDFIAPHTYSLTAKGVVKQIATDKD